MNIKFLLVHDTHLLFVFNVVCTDTEVHCLLTNDENSVSKTLSEYCCRCCCLVTSVVSVSVRFTELHKGPYLYCSCFLVQSYIVYQQIMEILL